MRVVVACSFGYFEGTFIKGTQNALLSWWETYSDEAAQKLIPNVGSAFVSYSEDWSTVSGGYSGTGMSLQIPNLGSWYPWLAEDGERGNYTSSAEGPAGALADFQKYCMLTIPAGKSFEDVLGSVAPGNSYFQAAPDSAALDDLPVLDKSNWKSEQVI
jgi:hypothetical protein